MARGVINLRLQCSDKQQHRNCAEAEQPVSKAVPEARFSALGRSVPVNGGEASAPLLVRQSLHAWQLFALEELQRCPASGGDVGDLIGYPGSLHRGHAVAAANN